MPFLPPLIYIVDDDPSVGRALKRLLRSWGMRTLIFSSGEALLADLTQSQAVDCVVLDVKMPGMTGLEVQDYIKHAGWAIPVIFITAHEDQANEAQALGNGAIGFLRKPFAEQDLMRFIRQALRQRGTTRPDDSQRQ